MCLGALGHAVHVGLVEDLQVGGTKALCQLPLHALRHRAFQHNPYRYSSVVDPHRFQCGSGFSIFLTMRIQIRTGIQILGFDDQKLEKIYSWKKIAIYLSQGLPKGRPSYRRSLQPSKENICHFKTWIFFAFVFHFCFTGSGSRSVFPMRIPIPIHPTKINVDPCGSGSTTRPVSSKYLDRKSRGL